MAVCNRYIHNELPCIIRNRRLCHQTIKTTLTLICSFLQNTATLYNIERYYHRQCRSSVIGFYFLFISLQNFSAYSLTFTGIRTSVIGGQDLQHLFNVMLKFTYIFWNCFPPDYKGDCPLSQIREYKKQTRNYNR